MERLLIRSSRSASPCREGSARGEHARRRVAVRRHRQRDAGPPRRRRLDTGPLGRLVRRAAAPTPGARAGWKIHVSATPLSAAVVLSRAIEVIVAEGCTFKFSRTRFVRRGQFRVDADRARRQPGMRRAARTLRPSGVGGAAGPRARARGRRVGRAGRRPLRVTAVVGHSYRGGVFVATDRTTGSDVILKQARPYAMATLQGTDARDNLRHEAAILDLLAPLGLAPRAVALVTHGRSARARRRPGHCTGAAACRASPRSSSGSGR